MNFTTDEKQKIRSILETQAQRGRTIYYGELGNLIGREAVRSWPELDEIANEDHNAGRPDLTLCVVSTETSMPSKYLQQPLNLDDSARAEQYFEDLTKLFDYYS